MSDRYHPMRGEIDYDRLDPGIRDVVRAINEWGWVTTDSGDGVSKPADSECVLDFPHVFAEAAIPGGGNLVFEAQVLAQQLVKRFGPGWYVEANYSTKDGLAILCAQKDVPKHSLTDERCPVETGPDSHRGCCLKCERCGAWIAHDQPEPYRLNDPCPGAHAHDAPAETARG